MLAFSAMLDRVGDLLMDRAGRTDVRDEQALYLDARALLKGERPTLMAEFEQRLRKRVDDRFAGRVDPKADFANVDPTKLTLVDISRWTSRSSPGTSRASSRTPATRSSAC